MKKSFSAILFLSMLLLCLCGHSQDSLLLRIQGDLTKKIPLKYLSEVSARADELSTKVEKKSMRALSRLQKDDEKIRRKLHRLDSTKAKEVFEDVQDEYRNLERKLQNANKLTNYLGSLDTLKTSLKFLQSNQQFLSNAKNINKQLNGAINNVKGLESSLARAENVKAFIRERTTQLKSQLTTLQFAKELKNLNKQTYYYNAQISEYKQALQDPKKIERKALELLSKTKPFQEFMRKNSELASLFRLPGNEESSDATGLQGLQTRASVNAIIQDRIGGSVNAQELFRQNVQGAQMQISQLKNAVAKYANGWYVNSSSDIEMPSGFKPNTQKTKSFLKRLEYGANVQSQRATNYFPVTSDIALSLGYKINDKSSVGVGASYKLGFGQGWSKIALTHEGFGLRSYLDYKIKGSLYISGGYEQNYRTAFASLDQLKDYSAWQSSGLIGAVKKYSLNKKLKGNMQILWDFLSYRQIPQTPALLFRVGYTLK